MASCKLLILFSVTLAEVFIPGSARSLTSWDVLQKLVFKMSELSCRALSYEGCCNNSYLSCCIFSETEPHCCCDQMCHSLDDCCDDIKEIGCFAPGSSPAPPSEAIPPSSSLLPEATNLCAAKMKIIGTDECCNPTTTQCFITTENGTCSCDRNCYIHGDCCPGLEENGCYARNCSEAGIPVCCNSSATNCKVITSSNTSCFCDSNCYSKNGNNPECCSDMPESCPNTQAEVKLDNVENMLAEVEERIMKERIAAAFWRSYLKMSRNINIMNRNKK